MTVAAPNCRNDYVGTGATATYPYTFRIFDETHLRVYRRTAAGVLALLVLTTDYTVTGVGDVNGGNVVLVAGNLESLADLSIRRVLPLTQLLDIRNEGAYLPSNQEDEYDRLVMIGQQLDEELSRALSLPEDEAGTAALTTLPTATSRALQYLAFDANSNPIAATPGLTTPVGSLVVDSIAALRALSAPSVATTYLVRGYTVAGDGGAGLFRWVSADVAADNGGTIIAPAVGAGRWYRLTNGVIYPEWFGVGLGGADDTAALNTMIQSLTAGGIIDFNGRSISLASASLNALTGRVIKLPADRLTLRGNGAVITVTGTADCGIFDSSSRNYITYEGISFVGNNKGTVNTVNYGTAINHTGTGAAADMTGLSIRKCRFKDFAGISAVYVASLGTTYNLREILMDGCESTGGDTITPLNGGWISSLVMIATNTAGEVQDVTITENVIYGAKLKVGIMVVGNSGAIRYVNVSNNIIHDVGTYYAANGGVVNSYAINLKPNVYDAVVHGNIIKSAAQIGIYSNIGYRHSITNNYIEDVQDTDDVTLMRGAIVCASPNSIIANNQCTNCIWGFQGQCPDAGGRSDIVVANNSFSAKQPVKLRFNPNAVGQGITIVGNRLINTDATYHAIYLSDHGTAFRWDEVAILDNDIVALGTGIKNQPGVANSGWHDLRIEGNRISVDAGRGISFDGDFLLNYSISHNRITCTANSTFGIYMRNDGSEARGAIVGNIIRDNTNAAGRAFELFRAFAILEGNRVLNCTHVVFNAASGAPILGYDAPTWTVGANANDFVQSLANNADNAVKTRGEFLVGWRFDGAAWLAVYEPHSVLSGAYVYNPANMASGAGTNSGNLVLTGAVLGDLVEVAAPYDLQGIIATAYVQAADSVVINLFNPTGGAIDLASGTWLLRLTRQ